MIPGFSVSPALNMGSLSNESDRLTLGLSDVMCVGMQHSPESSTDQDVDFAARAGHGDLNSMYQTRPHQDGGGPSDRLLTNSLNTSSLYTGYDTERGEGRVDCRSLYVNANALLPRFHDRQPINREQFLRDCRSPVHRMTQKDLFPGVSPRAGCGSNPSTRTQIANEVENLSELSGDLPYHPAYETAGAYTLHVGSSVNGMDGILSTDSSPAETAIQTHALFPYVVAAHIDCCKVGAEPADVKRLDEVAMNYHVQPKNNNFRPSPEAQLELDTVMAKFLKMIVDVKEEIEELSNTEKAWCDEMHEKLRLLGPSSSVMGLPTGYGAEANMSAWANEGSTSVIGEQILQGRPWANEGSTSEIGDQMLQGRAWANEGSTSVIGDQMLQDRAWANEGSTSVIGDQMLQGRAWANEGSTSVIGDQRLQDRAWANEGSTSVIGDQRLQDRAWANEGSTSVIGDKMIQGRAWANKGSTSIIGDKMLQGRPWANVGSTSVIRDKMLRGPYWENRSGLISEEAKEARALKDWLKSKHTHSEISRVRGQCKKKRRQGKHSQTSREVLVEWFESHCEWPYPSVEEKLQLARLTGLETRQIDNWFINQRKRHWESHVKNQTNLQIELELRTVGQGA